MQKKIRNNNIMSVLLVAALLMLAAPAMAEPSTPFVIDGWVLYENDTTCDNPAVNITNLNTSAEWQAETDASYYQITRANGIDLNVSETLQFNAMSPDGSQFRVIEHTVTQDEVNGGGISNFNITLASSAPPPTLVEYTITNRTITPPQTTNIDVEFSEEVEWKIAIENGGVVHDWTGTSTNPTKKPWNGTYEGTATVVPDGAYVVNITWTNTTTGLGGQNNTEIITVSTSLDTTPPTITNIANGTPTDSSVTITWTTDEASDSLVKYGTTSGTYTDSEPNAAMVTSHSITLTGLSSDMTYYFVVNSTDASGNSNESEEHNFTTAAESITQPELISCVITPTPPVVQGTNVSIDCLFSERVNYEIRIENATSVVIETIGSGTAKNPDPKWWNTTTGTPAGTYLVNVTMDNSTSGLSSYNDTNTIEVIAAAEMPTASIGSAEGSVGDTVNVSINITDALAIGAMDIRVTYNASILNATNVANGSMIESLPAPLVAYHISYVDINVSFITLEAINGDGELFIVTFDVVGGDAGDSSILAMEAEAYTNDTPPQPVDVVTKNGVVNVTDDAADTTPPMVIGNSPTGTGVLVTTDVTVTFDEAMNTTSAEDAFSINDSSVTGTFSWAGDTMTFDPDALEYTTTYEIAIGTGAEDLAGNPLAEPFTWNFTTATVMPTSTTVSIENVTVAPGESVIVPIMVNSVTNLSGCAVNITYNASVVHVTDVTPGDMNLLTYNINNGSGWMYANAINTSGLSGDVVFAYVNLTAVGSKGDTSPLDITVVQLCEPYNPITHTVIDGTFTIEADTEPPLVTDASASKDEILNDNGKARAPGTNVTVLNVTVTDEESDVASVTIDLSSIGGSPVQPMEHITGTGVWTVTTNATDGVNLTHQLTINATDGEGNYNNTVAIELTVLRRGDVCRDNVIDGNDVMYIARYLAGLEPESSSPPTELVGDVVGISGAPEGDGTVDMMDVLYIARCEAGLEDEP